MSLGNWTIILKIIVLDIFLCNCIKNKNLSQCASVMHVSLWLQSSQLHYHVIGTEDGIARLFVAGLMSYLRYLCLYIVVSNTCCVVLLCCLRLVCPILLVSLDCPFLIVPSMFSGVYLDLRINVVNNGPYCVPCLNISRVHTR